MALFLPPTAKAAQIPLGEGECESVCVGISLTLTGPPAVNGLPSSPKAAGVKNVKLPSPASSCTRGCFARSQPISCPASSSSSSSTRTTTTVESKKFVWIIALRNSLSLHENVYCQRGLISDNSFLEF